MKEISFKVKGMVCGGCEASVQNAVKSIKGIKKVIADHETGTVTVLAKESIHEMEIKEKIEDIGFEII